jgi:DNA-binding NarL/FixJ family response regulator
VNSLTTTPSPKVFDRRCCFHYHELRALISSIIEEGAVTLTQTSRVRVVLIDDDELTRGVLRFALPAEIYEVVGEAASGRTGLEVCLRCKPELIFLDVTMPEVDGLTILPAIRDAFPHSEVLMVTASNDRITIEKAIMGGASAYIVKPLTAGKIEDALRRPLANVMRKRAGF